MPGTAVGCCICGRVCAYTESGQCARQVGQENVLLIVFEVCKANQRTSLIFHRRRVACNLPQIRLCAHTTGRQELQIPPQSLLLLSPLSVFLFFFYLRDTAQGTIVLVFVLPCHWERKRREEKRREAISHYESSGNCRTTENEQGNLLPINCIFVCYSYHPN